MKISLKLSYQYMTIFFNFSPASSHLRPLQVDIAAAIRSL